MNRSTFLQNLGLGSAGLFLPPGLARDKPIKIYDNYVRGTNHYALTKVRTKVKEGDELLLQREADNTHDSFAIEVYWQEHKMGYIPAYENIVLANMLDAGVELQAFVSQLNARADIYDMLALEVYAHLIIASPPAISSPLSLSRSDDAMDTYRQGYFQPRFGFPPPDRVMGAVVPISKASKPQGASQHIAEPQSTSFDDDFYPGLEL